MRTDFARWIIVDMKYESKLYNWLMHNWIIMRIDLIKVCIEHFISYTDNIDRFLIDQRDTFHISLYFSEILLFGLYVTLFFSTTLALSKQIGSIVEPDIWIILRKSVARDKSCLLESHAKKIIYITKRMIKCIKCIFMNMCFMLRQCQRFYLWDFVSERKRNPSFVINAICKYIRNRKQQCKSFIILSNHRSSQATIFSLAQLKYKAQISMQENLKFSWFGWNHVSLIYNSEMRARALAFYFSGNQKVVHRYLSIEI
jgi:hypothetical protein